MTNYYSLQENASTAEKISPSSQDEVNLRGGRSTDGQFRTCIYTNIHIYIYIKWVDAFQGKGYNLSVCLKSMCFFLGTIPDSDSFQWQLP